MTLVLILNMNAVSEGKPRELLSSAMGLNFLPTDLLLSLSSLPSVSDGVTGQK